MEKGGKVKKFGVKWFEKQNKAQNKQTKAKALGLPQMVKAGDPVISEQSPDMTYSGFSKHSDNRSVCPGRQTPEERHVCR